MDENPAISVFEKHKVPLVLLALGFIFFAFGLRLLYFTPKPSIEFLEGEVMAEELVEDIAVDIGGAVEKPGVYTLNSENRLQDALLAAGGLSSKADREWVDKHINLASKITDGSKIYIPFEGEVETYAVSPLSTNGTGIENNGININSANQSELEGLPGIGPVTAQKIISNRPYTSLDELVEKRVLTKSVFEKIKDQVSVY